MGDPGGLLEPADGEQEEWERERGQGRPYRALGVGNLDPGSTAGADDPRSVS